MCKTTTIFYVTFEILRPSIKPLNWSVLKPSHVVRLKKFNHFDGFIGKICVRYLCFEHLCCYWVDGTQLFIILSTVDTLLSNLYRQIVFILLEKVMSFLFVFYQRFVTEFRDSEIIETCHINLGYQIKLNIFLNTRKND